MTSPTAMSHVPGNLQTPKEERVNSLTHGIAALLSLVGIIALMGTVKESGTGAVMACLVYGASLVGLFSASTFYHACWSVSWKAKARMVDHCAIFVLIAGTYTPLVVLALADWRGWTVLTAVWICAVLGICHKLTGRNPYGAGPVVLCLLMGWLVVVVWTPMVAGLGATAVAWLIAGGVTYSLGVPFYAWDGLPYNHGIWHLFVMGGAACHYLSVLTIV